MSYGTFGALFYGDGSDGVVTIGADTTLARDMYYQDLTVSSTFNLISNNFRILIRGTLTVNGTIHNDGTAGSTAAGVTTFSAGGVASNTTTGSIGYGLDGGNGMYNASGNTATTMGVLPSLNIHGTGGAGGAGGTQSAGAASTQTATLTRGGSYHDPISAVTGRIHAVASNALSGTPTTYVMPGGGGGGGGGGDGTRAGGGGGCGGGPVIIAARNLIVASGGVIRSKGGNGGAGVSGGNTGGGGGGAGGPIILYYDSLTETGTIASQAGTGGAKVGTGVAGTNGGTSSVLRLSNL